MQRHPKPTNLTINSKSAAEAAQATSGPASSPMHLEGVDLSSFGGEFGGNTLTSTPPMPSSPPTSPGHRRGQSKTILGTFKSRSQEHAQQKTQQLRHVKDENDAHRPGSSMAKIYQLKKNPGSTPELSLVGSAENVGKMSVDANNTATPDPRPQASPHHSDTSVTSRRTAKPAGPFRNPLARTKSLRRDSHSKTKPDPKPLLEQPPNTAPLASDWPKQQDMRLLGMKGKEKRGKSAERAPVIEGDDQATDAKAQAKEKDKGKEKSGFMSGSKNAVTKTTKASGNFLTRLGKIGRSSSNNEKEVPDSEYVLKFINLPLVEQTRITRISKDLSNCRDKTEYWMPSLPWRCIDYLNLNCESEGLYRVPGSGPQVKKWQRRFDTELDVDLLDESELYDPNNIGSMLKSWLRDLPTEILPASLQASLAAELELENPEYAKMGQPAPQKLRDALSELSPFNYYLLFAITCHLSLLLSHKDKNRMDLNNLCICIGPCLRLERWLFNYLVGDWRHCWQGCFTEKQYLESEKAHEQGADYKPPPSTSEPSIASLTNGKNTSSYNLLAAADDRAVHSSGSSEPASNYEDAQPSIPPSSAEHTVLPRRPDTESLPETYRPAGSPRTHTSGTFSTLQRSPIALPETKRPSIAEDRKPGDDLPAQPRPPYAHSRSRSDVVPSSPGADGFSAMPGLPIRTVGGGTGASSGCGGGEMGGR
ncbi:hypothetical protein LTR91_023390 [Friedmanniomyces endolithicus]|uniref:Rho-GAP domain-containing protein n=1 Tax=Friedmanniomyces endolithicus TaxID=329885 RepID=A0AAN6H2B9_9PEZI|nr:hypothetical protein LTR35_006724 [Friedmanniomyces endolithicus]KAK0297013.1 hypothetical protein LTS00_004292 [Friedmanniomyces endolithicus]KAK0315008.1 hypothetical protein LTR82_012789 [Friedmanniomyces endolithicus]KAK0928183.1 hypothetical protein LTR57_002917 [Friedmanniomyces endolithicus]KAK0954285.1 hypothetical protein LTR91_023390 [Friedmanniomyces endolithicus]